MTRRSKSQQAADILRKLLHTQEDRAQRLYDAYDVAEAEVIKTRRALAALDQMPLPGLEKTDEESARISAPVGLLGHSIATVAEFATQLVGDSLDVPNSVNTAEESARISASIATNLTGFTVPRLLTGDTPPIEGPVSRPVGTGSPVPLSERLGADIPIRPRRQRIDKKAEVCSGCGHDLPWHLDSCTVSPGRTKKEA